MKQALLVYQEHRLHYWFGDFGLGFLKNCYFRAILNLNVKIVFVILIPESLKLVGSSIMSAIS